MFNVSSVLPFVFKNDADSTAQSKLRRRDSEPDTACRRYPRCGTNGTGTSEGETLVWVFVDCLVLSLSRRDGNALDKIAGRNCRFWTDCKHSLPVLERQGLYLFTDVKGLGPEADSAFGVVVQAKPNGRRHPGIRAGVGHHELEINRWLRRVQDDFVNRLLLCQHGRCCCKDKQEK